MNIRTRKLLGTVALFVMIAIYALLALAVAIVLQINESSKIVELVYYALAGLLWILPAGAIIAWMGRPDPPSSQV